MTTQTEPQNESDAVPHVCSEVALHPRCHPDAPPWAWLQPDGTLQFRCYVCNDTVASFELKDPPPVQCDGHHP